MEPTIVAAIIGAVTAAATTAATATTSAIQSYNSIGDAFTATVLNLSRRNFKIKDNTTEPIKGEWMVAPSNLTSFYDIIRETPNDKDKAIQKIKDLGGGIANGYQPWMTCTLAHAGGGWGPASVICYQDPVDKLTITLMMLIRPGYNYCAGVSLSRLWIGNQADGKGWEIYNHIEKVHTDLCQFSDGPTKSVEWKGNGIKVSWQPAKEMKFTIEDI